jgi:hypothetical protein
VADCCVVCMYVQKLIENFILIIYEQCDGTKTLCGILKNPSSCSLNICETTCMTIVLAPPIHIGMILNFVGFVNAREIITIKSTRNSNPGTCTNATK